MERRKMAITASEKKYHNAAIVTLAGSGERVEVFGNFDDFLYIRTQTGEPGWIRLN